MKTWYAKAKWLLPIIGFFALIVLLCYRLDFDRIANLPQQVDWVGLLMAVSLTLPFVLLKTLKWHHLLQTSQPSVATEPVNLKLPIRSHFVPFSSVWEQAFSLPLAWVSWLESPVFQNNAR